MRVVIRALSVVLVPVVTFFVSVAQKALLEALAPLLPNFVIRMT